MKYKLLSDKKWLSQKYEVEMLSTADIANIVGCTKDGVRVALLRHEIVLRKAGQSISFKNARLGHKSRKYKILNDADWLKEKYLVENLSSLEIAKMIGVKNANSVCQALIRHNIPIRSISDGLTCKRIDDGFKINMSVIVGGLLGDAMMRSCNKKSNFSYPRFKRKNKYYDHLQYVAKLLFEDGEKRIKEEWSECNNKMCKCFKFSSLSHKELLPIFREWYPPENNYKKVVPKNIELNATVLLHWFLDDGYAGFRKRDGKMTNQLKIEFCSESFSKDDQQMLCNQLQEKLGLKANIVKCKTGTKYRIRLSQVKENIVKFYEIIGHPPVASLAYKWKNINDTKIS